jgi:hypothetical protein
VLRTKPYLVPAHGILQYQYYLIPTHFTEDRFIQAFEVHTSGPSVVHHIQVLEGRPDPAITESQGPVELDPFQIYQLHGFDLESSKLIGNYTPGNNDNAVIYPAERGLRVHKNAILFLETHYTTNGTPTLEQAEVGMIFRKTPPKEEDELHTQWFYANRALVTVPRPRGIPMGIAPRDEHHEAVKEDIFIPEKDIRIVSLRPHIHSRGKDFLVEKVSVDKEGNQIVTPLLSIPSWDFNWQRNYYFALDQTGKSPVTLLGGEYLRATAHWDNSRFNPFNPNPNVWVYWGQQTKDEMMGLMMTYQILSKEEARRARK